MNSSAILPAKNHLKHIFSSSSKAAKRSGLDGEEMLWGVTENLSEFISKQQLEMVDFS